MVKSSADGEKTKLSKGDKTGAVIAAVILTILLLAIGVWFFTTALPALRQAFTL